MCLGCDKFVNDETELPQIKNNNEEVISKETAYQMTSILARRCAKRYRKEVKIFKSPFSG